MVLSNQLQKILLNNLALGLADPINPARLELVRGTEQTLPACHRICAHNGVRGLEVQTRVLGCAAGAIDEFRAEIFGYAVEVGLMVRGG